MAHQQHQSCIDACYKCVQACDYCAISCLQEQDVKMMARFIALDIDCAVAYRLAASYMSRGSESIKQACAIARRFAARRASARSQGRQADRDTDELDRLDVDASVAEARLPP